MRAPLRPLTLTRRCRGRPKNRPVVSFFTAPRRAPINMSCPRRRETQKANWGQRARIRTQLHTQTPQPKKKETVSSMDTTTTQQELCIVRHQGPLPRPSQRACAPFFFLKVFKERQQMLFGVGSDIVRRQCAFLPQSLRGKRAITRRTSKNWPSALPADGFASTTRRWSNVLTRKMD